MTAAAALPRGAPAVQACGLVKEFEKGRRTIWQRLRGQPDKRTTFRAVGGIDLVVEAGEIFGLLGPDGAGKTNTMKMLSTLRPQRRCSCWGARSAACSGSRSARSRC